MHLKKNGIVIRPKSHHTMQRTPEDRVLPYNGQKMLDTIKTDLILLVYIYGYIYFKNISIIMYQS